MGRGVHRGFITYEELNKSLGKRNLSDENLSQAFLHILDGKISLGHARCLVGYVGASELAKRIVKEDLSVRYVESLFHKQDINKTKDLTTKKIPNEKDADTAILEKELSLKLGVKLTINDKNNKGSIKIQYRNIDQRENIIKKLTGGS